MLSDAELKQFKDEGYFIVPEAFSAEEIDELVKHIDYFDEQHEKQLQKVKQEGISRSNEISFTAHLAAQDPTVLKFVSQQKFVDLATELLKSDISLYWDQSVYKRPETPRDFPWHQDNGYLRVEPAEYVTCWIALNDVKIENGSIWVIPRSHTLGLVGHEDTPIGKQCYFGSDPGTPVELKKGGMAVFSSLLFHRSGPNVSNITRKAYIVQYSVAHARKANGEPFNNLVIARNGQAALA